MKRKRKEKKLFEHKIFELDSWHGNLSQGLEGYLLTYAFIRPFHKEEEYVKTANEHDQFLRPTFRL